MLDSCWPWWPWWPSPKMATRIQPIWPWYTCASPSRIWCASCPKYGDINQHQPAFGHWIVTHQTLGCPHQMVKYTCQKCGGCGFNSWSSYICLMKICDKAWIWANLPDMQRLETYTTVFCRLDLTVKPWMGRRSVILCKNGATSSAQIGLQPRDIHTWPRI